MDADGNTKNRGRRPTKKLKFKPKVPPQKPKKTPEKPEQEEQVPVDEELIKLLRTPQKAAKTLPTTKEERSKQSPPSTPPSASAAVASLSPTLDKENHLQKMTLQSPRVFPITVKSGVLYNKEEEEYDDDEEEEDNDDDDDSVEFQENQQSSTECEAWTHPAEELGLLEKESKERMFLFQLPKTLPLPRRSGIVERKGKATSREGKEGSNLQELPQGYLGKMLVYKSGKIKMKIGDVIFDVNPGAESRMVQHVVAVNSKEKHCCLLGEIENRHIIVTPDVDSLLNNN